MKVYKIDEVESGFPDIFPTHVWVSVQAIEKSTNLIRLFTSKPLTLDLNKTKKEQYEQIDKFVERFVSRINDRNDYEIINYHEDLKFNEDKRKRPYCRYLINSQGIRWRNI